MTSVRLAQAISAVGHPLVTIPMFLLTVAMHEGPHVLPVPDAWMVIVGAIVPVGLWNLRQTRAGRYANFDVSVRRERTSMYAVTVGVLVPATIALHWAPVAPDVRAGTLCMTFMFTIAWMLNAWIKVSLHAAVSFYLAIACTRIDLTAGVMLLVYAAIVSGSRLILRRHTVAELWLCSALGVATGVVFGVWGR